MLAGGAAGWWLHRCGRDREASLAAFHVLAVAAALEAFASGLGLHSLALEGVSLLVAMAGVLLTLRAAVALASFNIASVMLMLAAHRLGWMAPVDVALRMEPEARVIGHLVLTSAGLVAALTLARPLQRSLRRALTQERRLSQLLRLGSDWAWELDTSGRLTMVTASFEHHTGRRVDEFMRLGLPGGPSIVDDADWRELRTQLAARTAFRERVISYRCTDGTLLVVKASGEPMRDDGGRFIAWWGVSRNVTAEVQAQRERQRSREMLERLFRESPDAIFVAPVETGRLMMFNDAFVQLSGFSPDELQGRSGLTLGLWRDTAHALQLRALLQRGGRVRDWRSECWTRSGERRELLITAGRFEWDGEAVAVFTARDITESRRLAQVLAEARNQAEAASQAKSAFLASMSHEIRTPLNGVLGLARLLQDPALQQAQRQEYLRLLAESAEGLSGIVSDVLDLTKIEAGRLQVERVPFDLGGLEMRCELDESLPLRVLGDPVRLRQILSNYLSNALKFTQRGTITLSVRPSAHARPCRGRSPPGTRGAADGTGRRGARAAGREGHRHRRAAGAARPAVPALRAGRRLDHAPLRRHRAGPVDLPPAGGADGRHGWRRQRRRDRQLLLAGAAATAGGRTRGAARGRPAGGAGAGRPARAGGRGQRGEHADHRRAAAPPGRRGGRGRERRTRHRAGARTRQPPARGADGPARARARWPERRARAVADPRTQALPVIALSAAVLEIEREQAQAAGMRDFIAKPVDEAAPLRVLGRLR